MDTTNEIARIETEIEKIRSIKLRIWGRRSKRNSHRTAAGLDACNARIYELGIKLREAQKGAKP